MQVQNISTSQVSTPNFQGKINIIPGDLSYEPAKYVRKDYSAMEAKIKDKPFDLFLKQKNGTVSVRAQKEKDFIRNKGIKAEVDVSNNADIYESVTNSVIEMYENKLKSQPKTFQAKINHFFKRTCDKFLQIMESNEGINT